MNLYDITFDKYAWNEIGQVLKIAPKKQIICLSEENVKALKKLYNILGFAQEQADEINAERGMSAYCSGFDPYDVETVPTLHYRHTQLVIDRILTAYHIECKKTEWDFLDEELPF